MVIKKNALVISRHGQHQLAVGFYKGKGTIYIISPSTASYITVRLLEKLPLKGIIIIISSSSSIIIIIINTIIITG